MQRQAEALKVEGNWLFSKGKYGPAAERYTEGITQDPSYTVLYVNRAMCWKKLGNRWQQVAKDAQTALSLNKDLMKAHYLLGVAQRELHSLPSALQHLTKALESAREQGDQIKDEIWRELAKTKYAAWQEESQQRCEAAAALKQQLHDLYQLQCQQRRILDSQPSNTPMAAIKGGEMHIDGEGPHKQQQQAQQDQQQGQQPGQQQQQQQAQHGQQQNQHSQLRQQHPQWQQWEQLLARAAYLDMKQEVPSHLTCPLTMEVFREPVITPAGFSYERSALLEHLAKLGKFDPISRTPMRESDVIPNIGLRNATLHYLDEHPWAWGECT
eukprot:GHRR01003309.1.p1 GENE.GHRR01003309.1~~GHRR01003309.1.p1  ORF type:complete len:326 (+),score=122.01 GHRR01003309.1:282-1259(+)